MSTFIKRELIVPHKYWFPTSETSHLGLFNFITTFSISTSMKFFSFIRSPTEPNTSLFNLFIWDDSCWTSQEVEEPYLSFMLNNGFSFSLAGYRLRSSDKFFPRAWTLSGITPSRKEFEIETRKDEQGLLKPYSEVSYQVDPKFFQSKLRGFRICQNGPNSQNTKNFSLSGIEFFGILETFHPTTR